MFLEYFLSQDVFIGEIYTLSSTRTRTKLGETLLTIPGSELDKIADLLSMCQKRAKLLLESNHFRKHTEGQPIIRETDFNKQLEEGFKMYKNLNMLFPKILDFEINDDAQQRILDIRVAFLSESLRMVYCYFTLLSAQCYKIDRLQFFKLLESFRNLLYLKQDYEAHG